MAPISNCTSNYYGFMHFESAFVPNILESGKRQINASILDGHILSQNSSIFLFTGFQMLRFFIKVRIFRRDVVTTIRSTEICTFVCEPWVYVSALNEIPKVIWILNCAHAVSLEMGWFADLDCSLLFWGTFSQRIFLSQSFWFLSSSSRLVLFSPDISKYPAYKTSSSVIIVWCFNFCCNTRTKYICSIRWICLWLRPADASRVPYIFEIILRGWWV